jgi:hypothetical protein
MSASPASNSFSPNPAAVQSSAVNRNCLYFSLSQPKGPYHFVTWFCPPPPPVLCVPLGCDPEPQPQTIQQGHGMQPSVPELHRHCGS